MQQREMTGCYTVRGGWQWLLWYWSIPSFCFTHNYLLIRSHWFLIERDTSGVTTLCILHCPTARMLEG